MKNSATSPPRASLPVVSPPTCENVFRLLVLLLLALVLHDHYFSLPTQIKMRARSAVNAGAQWRRFFVPAGTQNGTSATATSNSSSVQAPTRMAAQTAAGGAAASNPATTGPHAPRPLTFITLIYADWTNRRSFEQNIAHNCRVIRDAPGGHKLLVYTDLPYEEYCKECKCVRFTRRGCKCPSPPCEDGNSFCEKVYLFRDLVREMPEFVFMDRDFIILRESFVTRLAARAGVHDFLISYDHTHYKYWGWRKQINSGLFFMRRLPNVNYKRLVADYYKIGDNDDQPVVGRLMFDKYRNYDFLSYQWHCRFIADIIKFPLQLCIGLHDRGNEFDTFKRMGNYRMKMLNGTLYNKYDENGTFNVLPYSPPPLPKSQ